MKSSTRERPLIAAAIDKNHPDVDRRHGAAHPAVSVTRLPPSAKPQRTEQENVHGRNA
jgi:hypothetical protein